MRVLADTNVFFKFCRRLPLAEEIVAALDVEETDRCISAVTVLEIFRLWKVGRVADNPDTWIDLALPSWTVFPVTVPIARQSVLWPWPHKDPADRILAATAFVEGVELWHTDRTLKEFTGFPHRYFKSAGD